MNLREAAQQALEALEDSHQNINPERRYADELTRQIADAITSLRAALAENAMQRLTDEQQMIERGTKAWAGVPDATEWVEDLRGNEPVTICHDKEGDKLASPSDHVPDATKMMATSRESRQIEPVATINKMETVERLAREAGDNWDSTLPSDKAFLARFAAIAIAAEREACAKVCEEHWRHSGNAMNCADAIRARGNQE